MRRLPVKVHRVATEDEVEALAKLGVDLIGFDADEAAFYGFDSDPLWQDERHVIEGMLPALLEPRGDARAVVELPPEQLVPDAPARLVALGATLIQVRELRSPRDDTFVAACAASGAALVVDNSYIESTRPLDFIDIGDRDLPALAFYEADLFPTSNDPYAALVDAVDGAIGLEQIDEIARRAPLYLDVGATPDTVADVARRLSRTHVAGLAFRLGETRLAKAYAYPFDEVVAMLEVLQRMR